jgi:hypothetical protein
MKILRLTLALQSTNTTSLTTGGSFQKIAETLKRKMLVESRLELFQHTENVITWCREHPPMGGGIVAVSISSGQRCACF